MQARTQSPHRTFAGNIRGRGSINQPEQVRTLVCWDQHTLLARLPAHSLSLLLCPRSCFGSHAIPYCMKAIRISSFQWSALALSWFRHPALLSYSRCLSLRLGQLSKGLKGKSYDHKAPFTVFFEKVKRERHRTAIWYDANESIWRD